VPQLPWFEGYGGDAGKKRLFFAAWRNQCDGPHVTGHGERAWETTMAKGKKKLEVIHLVCEETGDQNYTLRRKTGGEKLKVKKYSPRLRKHTLHVEKKK
jgi:large subunit ribosomal protein L33